MTIKTTYLRSFFPGKNAIKGLIASVNKSFPAISFQEDFNLFNSKIIPKMIGIIEYGISCLSHSNILFTTKNNKIKEGPANIARMFVRRPRLSPPEFWFFSFFFCH